jgi:BirA family biotin operon repressor/biotin-[acetyl-CoA-carboxylase] ligase
MLQDFEREGFAPLQQRFEARDVLRGREVSTSDGLQGLCLGVSAAGALRLADAQGERDIHSSEVSVRPLKQDKDID